MAAHGLGRREHHSPRLWERECAVGRRQFGNGHGLVQLHVTHHRHHRIARYDIKYPRVGADYGLSLGWGRQRTKKGKKKKKNGQGYAKIVLFPQPFPRPLRTYDTGMERRCT
jgi:hypothetical protein